MLTYAKIDGVALNDWNFYEKKKIPYMVMAGFAVLLAISIYVLFCLFRIYIRKAKQMEAYESKKTLAVKNRHITPWMLYVFVAWVLSLAWTAVDYYILGDYRVFIGGILGFICIMAYLQGYLYFICNDFDYTQNVEKLNRRIDKHNADIGEREKRKLEIQEKIANGQLFLPDPEPPTPV